MTVEADEIMSFDRRELDVMSGKVAHWCEERSGVGVE
jgi:hypothetical protein